MFSYLHRYHAGNFADVHKHLVLTAILTTLHKKVTPFCVLDTHAGEGIYTLHSREIQKNAEYKKGFYPLLKAPSPPPLIQRFLNIITKEEKAYPGSPAFIHAFLRQTDRAILIEGHPQSFLHLKSWAKYKKNLSLHDRDSLEGLKALVPFKEKRGLVFIDPSYEVKTEYKEVGEALEAAFSRFSNGIYALWYPLLLLSMFEPPYHKAPPALPNFLLKTLLPKHKTPCDSQGVKTGVPHPEKQHK